MSSPEKLSCFVIMPFGEKSDTDGRLINFDVIYRYVIDAAVKELWEKENLKIECTRCDDIEKAGSIDIDMFNSILRSDIAIVDITTGNANVFYELGMRHTIRKNVTVIMRRSSDRMPFNIQGLRAIGYDPSDVNSFDKAKEAIQRFIVSGLRSKQNDSPIHEALPDLNVNFSRPSLRSGDKYLYAIQRKPDVQIGMLTGDLEELRGMADIWVSSENTDMQLARYHDRSISGLIRYLGARKDRARIVDDSIGNAVAAAVPTDAEGRSLPVNPGSVIPTDSGELKETHNVERIYHAATVQGTPGRGYHAVPNITVCVTIALSTADEENSKRSKNKLGSILFPVFGTGVAQGNFRENAKELIRTAVNHVENHGSSLKEIYFLAYDRAELTACLDVLEEYVRKKQLLPRAN